jgi:hypothetical protein
MTRFAALPVGADSVEITFGVVGIAWLLALLVIIVAGVITMAKGRWGWLVLGLLVGGLPWLVSACLAPMPGSLWGRVIGGASQEAAL